MKKTLILYHAQCNDGAASMWSAWKKLGDSANYLAIGKLSKQNSSILKKCLNSNHIFMCDMMLEMPEIEKIIENNITITILDHHITNIEKIKKYQFNVNVQKYIKNFSNVEKSGGGLTWDFFHKKPRPLIIDYIEDSDLWKFNLPNSKIIYTYLLQFSWYSNKKIIDIFNNLEKLNANELYKLSIPIYDYANSIIKKNLNRVGKCLVLNTYEVPILNTSQFISETGNIMAKNEKFAIIWSMNNNGSIRVSLRSDKNGINVGQLATKLGIKGGGHIHAAGLIFNSFEDMTKQIKFL